MLALYHFAAQNDGLTESSTFFLKFNKWSLIKPISLNKYIYTLYTEPMKSLFAFGDSYADYQWPMWPSIIGTNYDYFYNYGKAGCGNYFIFKQFIKNLHKITNNDTVIVQWTTPTRYDHTDSTHWICKGDASTDIFYKNNLEYLYSTNLGILKQLSYMKAVSKILNSINCFWFFIFLNDFSMVHDINHNKNFNIVWDPEGELYNDWSHLKDIELYKDHCINLSIDNYMEFINAKNNYLIYKETSVKFVDAHPTPNLTFQWIKKSNLINLLNLNENLMDHYVKACQGLLEKHTINREYNPKILIKHNILQCYDEQYNYKNFKL